MDLASVCASRPVEWLPASFDILSTQAAEKSLSAASRALKAPIARMAPLALLAALGWCATATAAAPERPAGSAPVAAAHAGPGHPARWESAETLRATAESFVRAHLPAGAARAGVRLHAGLLPARFPRCAAGHLQAHAFGNPSPYGPQTVQVACDAPQAWSVYLPVSVDWPEQVVVASHALAPGHALSPSDLQLVQRDRASLPPGALQSEAQAEGRVLRLGVAAGQSITDSMLAGPRLIHYGQAVSLIAEGDGVRLVALGIALQDGSEGQTVLVRNAQSGKVVSGVVDSRGDVVAALLH